MKQFISLVLLIISISTTNAQSTLYVDCQNPGWLSNLITYPQQQEVEDLTVSGYLNKTDIQFINTLIQDQKLIRVDLGNSVSTDGYVTFNYSIPILSDDKNHILGYKKIKKISMPQYDTFELSIGANSLVDTIQINSRYIRKAYGLTNANGWYNSDIKKIILGSIVEVIDDGAFFDNSHEFSNHGETIKYLVDSLPNSLKQISSNAFRSIGKYVGQSYVDPDPSLVNPCIVLPPNIEYIGGEEIGKPDYHGYTYNQWYNGEFNYTMNTIELPTKLKVWNGVRYVKSSLECMTHLNCDSLITPESMEKLWVDVNAKVGIFHAITPPEIVKHLIHLNTLYVPEKSLSLYQQAFKNCDVKEIKPIKYIQEIRLSSNSTSVNIGEQMSVMSTIFPEDALNKNLRWESLSPEIATVDNTGKVTGLTPGKATIIATSSNGVNGRIDIDVCKPTVLISSIIIDPNVVTGKIGEAYQLTATIMPEDASDKTLIWSSSNSTVAPVDSDGLITLHSKGYAIIKASAIDGSMISATCAVVVDDGAGINDIEIDGNNLVKIYNLQGALVYDGEYSESHLAPGTYIIISQGNRIKQIIH